MGTSPVPASTESGPGSALSPELQKAIGRVTEIDSLPEVTTRIVEIVEDPNATARDMHDVVRSDPALAAKILKVVNSAFYGLPSQIASLERAITMLGLSAVKNIALAASLARMFRAEAVSDQFAARDLWQHCVAVGVCARELGAATEWAQRDEVFVAGLVHDLGLIIVQQLFPDKLRVVSEECVNQPQDFRKAEQTYIGADHQAFGLAIAQRWKFPPHLCWAIGAHHQPESIADPHQRFVSLIYIADTICSYGKYGFWLTGQLQENSEEIIERVKLNAAQVDEVAQQLPDLVQEAEQIFAD
jgi:putative nucleotidyltransferase with HDIG domain